MKGYFTSNTKAISSIGLNLNGKHYEIYVVNFNKLVYQDLTEMGLEKIPIEDNETKLQVWNKRFNVIKDYDDDLINYIINKYTKVKFVEVK